MKQLNQCNTIGDDQFPGIEKHRKRILLNALIFPGMLVAFALGVLALVDGNIALGVFDLLMSLFFAGLNLYIKITGNTLLPSWIGLSLIFIFFIYLASDGGVENTAILWITLLPMLNIFLLGSRRGLVFSLLFLVPLAMVFFFSETSYIKSSYSTAFQIRISIVYVTICILSAVAENLRGKIHNLLVQSSKEKEAAILKLNQSIEEIHKLQDILPICVHCKKIRDDDGYWQAVEDYLSEKTEAQFSHALCPDCANQYYPDYIKTNKSVH